MRLLAVACAALLLAGCNNPGGDSDDPPRASSPPRITAESQGELPSDVPMSPAGNWSWSDARLDLGTGWGQLRFVAAADSATLTLTHDTIDEEDWMTGADLYPVGAFTIVRLDSQDSSTEFFWIGRDNSDPHFVAPMEPLRGTSDGLLTLNTDPGELLRLTVYTNVPDWHVALGGGGRAVAWGLGAHPALVATVPAPTQEGGQDIGPYHDASQRHWLAAMPGLPESVIYAVGWANGRGILVAAAEAGTERWAFGVAALGSGPTLSGDPYTTRGMGAAYESLEWRAEPVPAGDWEASLWMERSGVDTAAGVPGTVETARVSAGIAVLALPLAGP